MNTKRWAEKKIGRPLDEVRDADGNIGYPMTRDELDKLTAPPSLWWAVVPISCGVAIAIFLNYLAQ